LTSAKEDEKKMKIVACIKQVLDLSTGNYEIIDGNLINKGLSFTINPNDEYVIEESIRIKEKFGGTVTLITFGPERALETLQMGIAMGADEGIHIVSNHNDYDGHLTSMALFKIIKNMNPDLILCGSQSSDYGNSSIGPTLAEYLKIPSITLVKKIEFEIDSKTNKTRKKTIVHQEIGDGFIQIIEVQLPALFTIQSGINVPRTPTLKAILKSTTKEIKSVHLSQILNQRNISEKTKLLEITKPKKTKKTIFLQGEPEEVSEKLLQIIEELK
jgi:electron transfer flavoprotein beta subunit